MQDVKTLLMEEVKTRLYSRLRETANEIVKEIIQKEIAERVRQQVGWVPCMVEIRCRSRRLDSCTSRYRKSCEMTYCITSDKSCK